MEGPLSSRASALVLGVVAASVVASEVLFTRLLSVTTWYGVAFLVLSLAMLGVTRGSLDADRARRAGAAIRPWIVRRMMICSLSLVLATALILGIPMSFAGDLTSFASVLLVVVATTVPMVAASGVIARLMAESAAKVSTLYAIDLTAAALGALAPLVLLGPLSGPGAVVLVALLLAIGGAVLADNTTRLVARVTSVIVFAVFAATTWTSHGLTLRYVKGMPRNMATPPLFERWNALSHVELTDFIRLPFQLWSAPYDVKTQWQPFAMAHIDGEAGTVAYAYPETRMNVLDQLRMDAVTSAHVMRPTGTACVIGIGGGRDLESALIYGHDRVVGVEINPAMVEMLKAVATTSPIINDPRVHVTLGDGRTEYARNGENCRVLQASLVDTWAATSAGAFAHTEATLYTREAWAIFLNRVAPDGVLTFSRWYEPKKPSETARLVSLAVASLIDRGVTDPHANVIVVAAGNVATILVSPAPFTPDDLAKLREAATKQRWTILFAPDAPPADPLLASLVGAHDISTLDHAGTAQALDTSAPTDDRPFFFQILAPSAWLSPRAMLTASSSSGALSGNVAAALQLIITFFAVMVVGVSLLAPTLWRAARAKEKLLPHRRAGIYFGALGAGFMLTEIGLVQRMHVVLGHPTYALVVVLAGLLVATGIGSALSGRIVKTRRHVTFVALAVALMLAIVPWAVIHPLANASLGMSFALRVTWTGGTAVVIGLLLGMLFPSGIAYVDREGGAPIALAINGATSVIGSVVAMTISVWFGIPAGFLVAAAVYVVAAACGPSTWQER